MSKQGPELREKHRLLFLREWINGLFSRQSSDYFQGFSMEIIETGENWLNWTQNFLFKKLRIRKSAIHTFKFHCFRKYFKAKNLIYQPGGVRG